MIPKVFFQTNKTEPEKRVLSKILDVLGKEWSYQFYNDEQVLAFFKEHPLDEFPDILQKYNGFLKGAHKADLFRYYYLYIHGGFFMDSDAMVYANLDWTTHYHFVSVNSSFHPGTIFQGILGASPKNEILKQALYHAYHTDPEILKVHYHYFCETLYHLLKQDYGYKIKLLEERSGSHGVADILDGDRVVFKHFWLDKIIPDEKSYPISCMEKEPEYNRVITDFIQTHHIRTVTDIGCGDLSSLQYPLDIDFVGIDCIPSIFEKNRRHYPMHTFVNMDVLSMDIRDSELYIIKDVFQDWLLKDIYHVLDTLLTKNMKYILLTHDATQLEDNVEWNQESRGLSYEFLPLKKYKPELLFAYGKKHTYLLKKTEQIPTFFF